MTKTVVKKGKWSDNELEYLKDNYGKITAKQIANNLNRTKSAVQLKANRIGLEVEDKYSYNKDFFENIDDELKAYWLGFIAADGSITSTERNHELSIKLKKSDINHLKKFNVCINGNIPPSTFSREVTFPDQKYNGRSYEGCQIRLYSSKVVQDLIFNGIYPNKTYKENSLPKIEDELMWHYIRGFLDGDGHIMVPKSESKYGYAIGFTGLCESFFMELKEFFKSHGIVFHLNRSRNLFKLETKNKKYIKLFLEKCYNRPTVYLDRKYKKYQQLMKLLSEEETL